MNYTDIMNKSTNNRFIQLALLSAFFLLNITTNTFAATSTDSISNNKNTEQDSHSASFQTVSSNIGNVIDEIEWVIGDEVILKSDIEKQILQLKFENQDIEGDPYCTVPEELAVRKLFLNQAALDSVEANENQVNMQVEQRMNSVIAQIGSEEKVAEYFGKPINELKESLKTQAREQMMIQQVQSSIIGKNKATPSAVRKYWTKDKGDDELPEVPTQVEVELISIEPKITTKELEDIKAKLRDYKNRVENQGTSFSMLATLYSDDIASARNGGELGFMGKGQLVPEYANELFSMKSKDKLSKIVRTDYGFHLIQFIERKADKINSRHILIKPKPSIEAQQKTKNLMDSITNLLREGKITMQDAVDRYSTDKETKQNGGLMENQRDGSSKFEYQALPSEISRRIYNMNIGEISDPFFMENSNGHTVCAIVKLKSKTEQHTANLEQDYQLIKTYVENKFSQETLEKWIRERQSEIYTRINSSLKGCTWRYPGWNFSE